jgi:hypothetical protein
MLEKGPKWMKVQEKVLYHWQLFFLLLCNPKTFLWNFFFFLVAAFRAQGLSNPPTDPIQDPSL